MNKYILCILTSIISIVIFYSNKECMASSSQTVVCSTSYSGEGTDIELYDVWPSPYYPPGIVYDNYGGVISGYDYYTTCNTSFPDIFLYNNIAICPDGSSGPILYTNIYQSCTIGPAICTHSDPSGTTSTPCTNYFVSYDRQVVATCSLQITTINCTGSGSGAGCSGDIDFSTQGSIAKSPFLPITWTGKVADQTSSGTGGSFSFGISNTYADGTLLPPGTYTATASAQTANNVCADTQTATITINPPLECNKNTCDSQCGLNIDYGSSANMATGGLSNSQDLFSAKGGPLPFGLTIYYNSLDPDSGSLGRGWSHSYDYVLTENSDGSVLITEPNKKYEYFTLANGNYIAAPGDYSTLAKNPDGTFSLTTLDGKVYTYVNGNITTIADRNGNTISFVYNDDDLISASDQSGRVISFVYDGSDNLSSVTDPLGNVYGFSVGSSLSSVTQPDGGKWQYGYDANNYMLTKTDPVGNTTSYLYDAQHRTTSSTDPIGQTRNITYPTTNGTTLSTNFVEKDGGNWLYTYNTTNNTLTSKTDPLGNSTSYTYDSNGNMLTKTEPVVGTTSYTYDGAGNMISTTNPLIQTTTYTYNALGQVLAETGPQGATTNTYDGSGNLLTTTDAAGATTTYQYDANGHPTKITNAKNQATTMTYTATGLLATTADPAGAITTFTYDAMGNMLTQTDPLGKVITSTYDGMNRLTSVTDPMGNVTTYAYDKLGNRTSVTDANGNTTTYTYNYRGQVLTATDALGNVTSYSYGSTGCPSCGGGVDKLTSLADAKSQATLWQYDQLGRQTIETDPLGMTTSFVYDPAGDLQTKTDAIGATINYAYDALKRLTGKKYPDLTTVSYSYDSAGRLQTTANQNVNYNYTYDPDGRMTSAVDSRGYVLNYEYDAIGNRTKTTLQSGGTDQHVIGYTYDNANRITTITSPAGTFTYGYDNLGRRTRLAYPNQIATTYSYDSASRLTGIRHAAGTSIIAFANYSTFDKTGNRTSKTTPNGSEQYSYDTIYRLTQAKTPNGTENFSYDTVGNRLTGPGAKDTAQLYNAGNQMTRGRQFGYTYDNNGNQAARSIPAATDRSWNLTWDFENRLTKMEKIKGTTEKQTFIFKYDPQGRRIEKDLTTIVDGVVKASTWTYVYDNDNIALEIYNDPTGTAEKTFYTHGPVTDEHLALERNGSYFYYHADGLGSVTALTDQNKAILQSYSYDSFGMVKSSTSFRNAFTYTAREWDKETGLYYYRKRYYDPMEGRFVSKDPIGFRGGINLYGYVYNNPIILTDPYGEDALNGVKTWYCRNGKKLIGVCADTGAIVGTITLQPALTGASTLASVSNAAIADWVCSDDPAASPSTYTTLASAIPVAGNAGKAVNVIITIFDLTLTAIGK